MSSVYKKVKEIHNSLLKSKSILSNYRNGLSAKELRMISNILAGIEYDSRKIASEIDNIANYKEKTCKGDIR